VERHRFFCQYFSHVIAKDLPAGSFNVLHVAPEPSLVNGFGLQASPNVEYVTGDSFATPNSLVIAQEAGDKVESMDIQELRFKDNVFEFEIVSHVFEHVEDDVKAMRELFRVMKPGGVAFFATPISWYMEKTDEKEKGEVLSPEQLLNRFGQEDHFRKYGSDIIGRLEGVGWEVEKVDIHKWLASQPFWPLLKNKKNTEYSPSYQEIVLICRKK
jgi:SAM-dependent methyltransferase